MVGGMMIRSIILIACLSVLRSGSARADGSEGARLVVDPGLSNDELIQRCNDRYFPDFENRYISDAPIKAMIAWMDGKRTVGPAAGLDVIGVWWTPLRQTCSVNAPGQAQAPEYGQALHFVLAANVTLANLATDQTLMVVDPMSGSTTQQTLSESNLGLLLGGTLGVYYDLNFFRGGHGNRIQLAGLLGFGRFFGQHNDGNTTSIGLGLIISRD
jgi:hypothetical protein